jgi:hypothetical protein
MAVAIIKGLFYCLIPLPIKISENQYFAIASKGSVNLKDFKPMPGLEGLLRFDDNFKPFRT